MELEHFTSILLKFADSRSMAGVRDPLLLWTLEEPTSFFFSFFFLFLSTLNLFYFMLLPL